MHADWHSNAGKAGFLPVTRSLLVELLKRHSDKDISEIARYVAKETTKDIVLLLRKQYNTKLYLDVIETSIKASNYPYQHEVNDTRNTDSNKCKLSIFCKSFICRILDCIQIQNYP
jgi:hypothetical protein